MKAKLQLWLLGLESAFDEAKWTKATYLKYRRTILRDTRIDTQVPFSPEKQEKALGTIRDLIDDGVDFQDYPDKWERLTEAHQ